LLAALDAQVSAAAALVAEVQLGEQQLQLAADRCYFFAKDSPLDLKCSVAGKKQKVATASNAADKESMRQQFVQQVEALLHLIYKLQLPQLQRVLHSCISSNSCFKNSLLNTADDLRAVASARVVDAAAGSGAVQEALISSSSSELCAFSSVRRGRRHLFAPLDLTAAAQREPLKFKAQVVEEFFSYKKGQTVRIELDLFDDSLMHVTLDEPGAIPVPLAFNLALGRQLQLESAA
jgi:hypothetical protein